MADSSKPVPRSPSRALVAGLLLICAGLAQNLAMIGRLFYPPDFPLPGPELAGRIVPGLLSIAVGGMVLVKRPALKWRSAGAGLCSLGLSLVLFMACEMGCRIWLGRYASAEDRARYAAPNEVDPAKRKLRPHPYLNYALTPGFSRGALRHNSLGFRGPEIDVPKPEDVYRIVILGGSTVYTEFVEDDARTFPARLEEALRARVGSKRIEVVNAGAPGYSTWESLINLAICVLDLEPDMMVVHHGANEVHARMVLPEAYRGDNSGRRLRWHEPVLATVEKSVCLRILLRKWGVTQQTGLGAAVNAPTYFGAGAPVTGDLTEAQFNALLDANPPRYSRRNLLSMVGIAKEHDITIVLSTWAWSPYLRDYASTSFYQRGFREQNAVVAEVAAETGVLFFDCAGRMPTDTKYWHDGRHVNVEGALVKANLFAEFLLQAGVLPQ